MVFLVTELQHIKKLKEKMEKKEREREKVRAPI